MAEVAVPPVSKIQKLLCMDDSQTDHQKCEAKGSADLWDIRIDFVAFSGDRFDTGVAVPPVDHEYVLPHEDPPDD